MAVFLHMACRKYNLFILLWWRNYLRPARMMTYPQISFMQFSKYWSGKGAEGSISGITGDTEETRENIFIRMLSDPAGIWKVTSTWMTSIKTASIPKYYRAGWRSGKAVNSYQGDARHRHRLTYDWRFRSFPQSTQVVPLLDHDCFLPDPYQISIHLILLTVL